MHGQAGQDDEIELVLSWSVKRVRLEVADEGPGFQAHGPDPDRPGGWGLALVESMADRWGIERGDRTRVWFELDRQDGRAA
jgi:two-component sensor histidine kinase